jgi:unsaturated chondroitin disaccharide hydrolase
MSGERYHEVLELLSLKLMEDEAVLGVDFPYVTGPSGAWEVMPASLSAGYQGTAWSHGNWFCGFWIGLHMAAYLQTGQVRHREIAEERLRLIAIRADDGNTHDIGFIFYSSAVVAYYITGNSAYRDLALKAANQLRRRAIVTERGAYISAWGPLDDLRGRRSSAIDTMANLPLLFWAAREGSDESFLLTGEAHAVMTRGSFLRDDLSTFHAVEYELPQGNGRGFTFQGYADDSCWSRGQAWAIYGYVATAAATGKRDYLDLAEQLAEYWFRRLAGESVPFWDFDDPAIPAAPRDSAAAAVVASALLDLAMLHPEPAAQAKWRARAEATLDSLCRDYVAWETSHRGLLKHGCYSMPHGLGTNAAVLFGDFYFVEALCSAVMPGRYKRVPARLPRLNSIAVRDTQE